MEERIKEKIFTYSPRVLSIVYIIFLSLFALDTKLDQGFLIHLIPSLIFTVCLIIAWLKPQLGGILFAVAGLGTIIIFNTYRDLFVFSIISLIPVLIGTTFILTKARNKN